MSQLEVAEKTPVVLPSNPTLLSAALAGLLCLSAVGCTTKTEKADPAGPGEITSSEHVENLTEEQFTEKCDARGGSVEVMPHCGGFATAKGFSYDSSTNELSEHSCKGANTCVGWNCAIPG
jgi:hypothetical protein